MNRKRKRPESGSEKNASDSVATFEKHVKLETEPVSVPKIIASLESEENAISEVNKFIDAAELFASGGSTDDVVHQFLAQTEGDLRLVADLIKKQKPTTFAVAQVFRCLKLLLQRVAEESPHLSTNVVSSLQQALLQSKRHLDQSLSGGRSKFNHVRCALRMLIALAMLSPEGARLVTQVVDFHAARFHALLHWRCVWEQEDVRTCALYLLLSVIATGGNAIVRQVLDSKGLIRGIFSRLVFDSASCICNFLLIFKTKVVKNKAFAKTMKLKIFNEDTLHYLVPLLNWDGSQEERPPQKLKKLCKRTTEDNDKGTQAPTQVSQEDMTSVQTAALEFLKEVCSTHKTGIAFRGTSLMLTENANHAITRFLEGTSKLYECTRGQEFIVHIMCACPEQVLYYLHSWMPLLSSASPSMSEKMIQVLQQVAEMQDVEFHLRTMAEKSPAEMFEVVKTLSLLDFVPCIAEGECMQASKTGLGIHLTYMHFLRASLGKIRSVLDLIRDNSFAASARTEDREKLETALISAVWQNVPPASELVSKYVAVAAQANLKKQVRTTLTEKEYPLINVRGRYCLAILKVLELYWAMITHNRDIPYKEEHIIWELLLQLCHTSTEALQNDVSENLQLRAFQLVINAAPTLESLFVETEKCVFHQLLSLLARGTDETAKEQASLLILQVLCKLSVLELQSREMTIWIEKFRLVPTAQHEAVQKLFTAAMGRLLRDPNMYSDEVMQCIMESNEHEENRSGKLWDVLQNSVEYKVNMEELDKSDCGGYFSPLLPAMLESLKVHTEPVCRSYVEAVIVEILHTKKQPQALCACLKNTTSQLSSSIQYYVEILSTGGLKHPAKDIALLEPNTFNAPVVLKLAGIFIRDIAAASRKKRKSASGGVDRDDLMSAVNDMDPSSRRSLFSQILCYTKVLFDHEHLLPLVPEYVSMIKAILEPTLDMSEIENKGCLHLLNTLLCHEMTLTWYLNIESLGTVYWAPSLEYTRLILDAVLHVCQKLDSAALASISDSLFLLKKKSVHSALSSGSAFSDILNDIVRAFATMFTQHDRVVLLEMLALSGDVPLDATEILVADLSRESLRQQEACISLSSAAVNRALSMKLDLEEDSKTDRERTGFGNPLLQLFMSQPCYWAALDSDCVRQLASSRSCMELLSLSVEQSPAHRRLIHKMISQQEINLHPEASPQGVAMLVSALAKTLPVEQANDALAFWLIKQFVGLSKWISTIEEEAPYSVVQLIADTVAPLLDLKLFGRKEMQKLLDIANNTKNHCLQLVLLNRICSGAAPDLKESLLDALLEHLLTTVCKAAQDKEPDVHVLKELERPATILMHFDGKSIVRVISRDNFWQQWVMSLLKSGFRSQRIGTVAFKLICTACERVYAEALTVYPRAAEIYMMILGHSKFLSLMLSTDSKEEETRGCLLQLMTTLVKCDGYICSVDHVPLLLSAYGATLSSVDQKILYLLYLYEENGVKISSFRPYMWGPSAASFYSVYKKSSRTLLKQPKTQEVLGLFNEGMMTSSLLKFPLHLDLQPTPCEDVADASVYDPRFMLPLLHNLLSPGSLLRCHQFVESRFLAYVLHSLSSEMFQLRSLGYNVLSLFYQHLEGSRFRYRDFWLCVLESLRNAVTVTSARLPCLLVGYLTSAVQVIHNPAHDSFNPVQSFLLAKPVIDINNVPDFYKMFFNNTVKHHWRRMWFLKVMADNLRSSLDYRICSNRYVLGIFQAYFLSPACNKPSKELVLKIFLAAVKIPKAARSLCREQGLLAWVSAAVAHNSEDATLTGPLFGIVHQVWQSSCAQTVTYKHKMAAVLKKEHEAISLLAPEHKVKVEVLRGDDAKSPPQTESAVKDIEAPPQWRFYKHFPFEFLLTLCDLFKYVRKCFDLTTATKYMQDMADALTYIDAIKSTSSSSTDFAFCLNMELIHGILDIWDHFSCCMPLEKLSALGKDIVRVCVHWLPASQGSEHLWLRTLRMALEHGKREDSGRLLKWVSLWLKSNSDGLKLITAYEHLSKIVNRASGLLNSGDCAPEQYETVIHVMCVLLDQAVQETENEGLRPNYEKAMRSLKKKSLTDKSRALATTLLLQELLLKKPKPRLFATCVDAE